MKVKIAAILASLMFFGSTNSFAASDHDWIIRGRALFVKTDVTSSVGTIGGGIDASTDQVPEIDFTRFFHKNFAAELILATTTHQISVNGSSLGGTKDLGSVKLLPPTLTFQYHINPEGKFRPYIGTGVNYTIFYEQKPRGTATSIKYDNAFGYAFQAGFDYMLNDKFGLNFDVKKLYLRTDVLVNGSIKAKVNLDPWIVGAGASYYF